MAKLHEIFVKHGFESLFGGVHLTSFIDEKHPELIDEFDEYAKQIIDNRPTECPHCRQAIDEKDMEQDFCSWCGEDIPAT